MNNLMKWKKIINIIIGAFITIVSVVMFIQSYEKYSDEFGTDISFNNDYVILLLIGLTILIYGIITFKTENSLSYQISGMVISSLVSFYSLGVFFKALNKAILDKEKNFDFLDNQLYLYVGIVGALILGYYTVSYFVAKKNHQ